MASGYLSTALPAPRKKRTGMKRRSRSTTQPRTRKERDPMTTRDQWIAWLAEDIPDIAQITDKQLARLDAAETHITALDHLAGDAGMTMTPESVATIAGRPRATMPCSRNFVRLTLTAAHRSHGRSSRGAGCAPATDVRPRKT
jgi:hypothetical protein